MKENNLSEEMNPWSKRKKNREQKEKIKTILYDLGTGMNSMGKCDSVERGPALYMINCNCNSDKGPVE